MKLDEQLLDRLKEAMREDHERFMSCVGPILEEVRSADRVSETV